MVNVLAKNYNYRKLFANSEQLNFKLNQNKKIMLQKLTQIIKSSPFKSWDGFQLANGSYSETCKNGLKARITRAINFMNKTLEPLGYRLTIEKID
jgi:hypothetical protein